jgi:hypothetical protein
VLKMERERGEGKSKSITKIVWQILDARPFLRDIFKIRAVNYSGLARYLHPVVQKILGRKVKLESIIVAIKRYGEKIQDEPLSQQILNALSKCDIMLKGNVAYTVLRRNLHNYEITWETYKKIKWEEGDIIYISHSMSEIGILLDKKNLNYIRERVRKDEIIYFSPSLAMITLRTPPEILKLPGFFSYILSLVSWRNINLIDVISTYSSFVLIVDEKDGGKVYNILLKAIKRAKKLSSLPLEHH